MPVSDPAPSGAARGHLLRVLGVAFGLAVMVGMTIGMGILRTPGEIAALVPSAPAYLLIWVLGASYALLGALTVSELATLRPRSGGLYPMVHDALGPFAGFVSGWTDSLAYCGSIAGVAIVFGEYIGPLVPALDGHEGLTASFVVIVFTLLQWRGIRVGNIVQLATSLMKGIALVALAIAAFVMTVPDTPASIVATTAQSLPSGIALLAVVVVALQSAIFTYDGWTAPTYFGEEMQDPGRELPRSIIGGVLLVLIIYMALNLAFLHVLGIEAMAGDPFVAASAASKLFGPAGDTVLRILMLVSLLAAVNALILSGSRITYAMSCDQLMPTALQRVNQGGTPIHGLLAQTIVVLALIATNTFNSLISLLAFFFVANYVLVFSAFFMQRRRAPDAVRPFRVPGHPVIPGLALAGSVAFLVASVWSDQTNSLIAIGLLVVSWPAYRILGIWMKPTPAVHPHK